MRPIAEKLKKFFCNEFAVFSIALILHVSIVFALGHYRTPALWENGVIAKSLLDGKGFAMASYKPPTGNKDAMIEKMGNGTLPPLMKPQPTSNQAPGYPFVLFITWKLLGRNTTAYLMLSLIQAILISSAVFPVGWLTRRWFGERAGILAMWIVCLMPSYAWFATRVFQPSIVITFHPWLLVGWLGLAEARSLLRPVGVGLATGLAGLFSPVLLGVFGLVGAMLLFKSLMQRRVANARMLLLAAALVLLVLTPWTVRSYKVHGQLVLIKNCFGKELWIGNNPLSTGTSVLKGGKKSLIQTIPFKFLNLTEMQLMKALQREAIHYVRSEPTAFVMRTFKKIVWFWTAVPRGYLISTGGAARLKFYWFQICYWFVFLLLAGFAWILHGRFPAEYTLVLIVYFVVYSMVYGLTHVGHARFRGEIEYIVIPGVAQGIILAWDMGCRFWQRKLVTKNLLGH